MDIFRRTSGEFKKAVDSPPEDSPVVIALKEQIRDLELDIFDLKRNNASLMAENTQLKAWNTSPENQSNDWFGKKNPSLSSATATGMERGGSGSKGATHLTIQVDNTLIPVERHSSESTDNKQADELLLPTKTTRLNRLNTLIFTSDSEFENLKINKLDIQMKCQVGKGSFGVVWKGLYKDNPVAVKLFISEEIDIRGEVYAMSKVVGLEHVMDLIGVVEEPGDAFKPPQVALVMPFMSNGSLQDICYKNSPTFMSRLSNEMKLKFCHQAAKGIMHLHHTNIIHRDLACRNLLVDDKMDIFVSDFGFARLKRVAESKGFTMTGLGPVRWEAPESLQHKEFSDKTDAFSYGVCVYEIVLGLLPWEHISSTAMVAVNVINGMRMIVPINCDPVLADVMTACWNPEPGDRPDFVSIVRTLGERYQQVLAEQKDVERRIGTIEFMIRGENVNKLPHQIHKKKITKKPQQRFLRLTSDLKNIFWRSSNPQSVFSSATLGKATERGIYIRDVLDVQVGQNTDTFKLQQMDMPVASSFSLITAERSVDIVCESSYHRDLWVAGMRLLMTRHKASVMDAELSKRLTWSLSSEQIDLGSFNLLRKVAYRLQLGDMLLKFTSRKVHARHVFLSSDLTELVWSVKEEGPVRKGRNKSLLLSEIDRIVVGVQPSILHSNASKQVSATAVRLSEKLTFRTPTVEHHTIPPPPHKIVSQNRNKKSDDDISQAPSKSNASGPSGILSRLFKDKEKDKDRDEKDKKKTSDRSLDRDNASASSGASAAIGEPSTFRSKYARKDQRGSDRGSEISSLDEQSSVGYRNRSHSIDQDNDHDDETDSQVSNNPHNLLEHEDHQLTVSYLGFDGRTLLSLKCPNKDCVVLWSDGVDVLLQGVVVLKRMSQAHQVHSYTHPRDLFADSGAQRQYSEESVFNNIKTPVFSQDKKPLNIFSTRPFSSASATAIANTNANVNANDASNVISWLGRDDASEENTPRAGSVFLDSKSTLTPRSKESKRQPHSSGPGTTAVNSSIPMNIDVSPSMLQQNTGANNSGESELLFQNMSPLSPHSNLEDHSTSTTSQSQSQSQGTRTNIPSLEFTLSETDTNSHIPPSLSSVQEPYFDDFELDEGLEDTATSLPKQQLHVTQQARSYTTSSNSGSSVVNSEALGSIEQREMDRIRHKMLQAQSSSSSSLHSSTGMNVLNKPPHISTSHGNTHMLSGTAGSSPMTEDSAYMLGDTLIHQGNSSKNSPFLSNRSSQPGSPYIMGDSMTNSPIPLPLTHSHSSHSHSHSQGSNKLRRVSESSMSSMRDDDGGDGNNNNDDDDEEEEGQRWQLRPDGIMPPSSTRRGVLDSSSDDEDSNAEAISLSHSEVNCHSDLSNSDISHSDVDDSEYHYTTGMLLSSKDVLQEFDDDTPRFSSDSVYEVMPTSRLKNTFPSSTGTTT